MNFEIKNCQNCKQSFTIEPDDFSFYEKMNVPPPTWCPECRFIRRNVWRNERTLYKRKCELCGAENISVYHPRSPIHVYCNACWWGDSWDGISYGVDYDPSRPFMGQVGELLYRVPLFARFGLETTLVNSPYTNAVGYLKNCYFLTHSDFDENCAYGSMVTNSKECFDNYLIDKCELCYECVNCRGCYATLFSVDCESCHNVAYSRNCVGCSDCYGCVNLRNKKYCIFNEQYSKEEYESRLQKVKGEDPRTLWHLFPQKYMHGTHNRDVSGDYIYQSKNTFDSYIVVGAEDCRFCSFVTPSGLKDAYDFSHYGITSERIYETLQAGDHVQNIKFSWFAISGDRDVEYSLFTVGCTNIFGSVGLRKKEYCILNKQYSPANYTDLKTRIIADMKKRGEYGEFFPASLSPFAYNETTAHEFFPLSKEKAIAQGYRWRDTEERSRAIGGDIIGCAHEMRCAHKCPGAFRVIQSEKDFFIRFSLLLPTLCPNCRHGERLVWRNPITLYHRTCTKCGNNIQTSYAPERKEIVYCESCYQSEVG